jgi:hypothetical protein
MVAPGYFSGDTTESYEIGQESRPPGRESDQMSPEFNTLYSDIRGNKEENQ